MTQRFEGKIAVITGGNSGIGLATAKAFVAEGAKVVIIGRSEATLKAAQDELGSCVLALRTDGSRVADITRAMEQIRASFGRIDVLFVNAGIAKFVPLEDVTEEMFDETMSTNLKGAYFTVQKALPLLSNGAAVVLNASISAHVGMPNTSVYAASKAGVLNLAKTRSADLILNALYGGTSTHPMLGRGSDLEDPQHPGRFRPDYGAYRLSAGNSLLSAWDRSIPVEDKSTWRSPEVADAYVKGALASDDTSTSRVPPSFRAPSGAMEDSFYQASGRQLWDASLIRVPTLVVRSANDFWSRPEDAVLIAQHLVHAPVRAVTIPEATHFVHLDRQEHGRAQMLSEVLGFLRRLPR